MPLRVSDTLAVSSVDDQPPPPARRPLRHIPPPSETDLVSWRVHDVPVARAIRADCVWRDPQRVQVRMSTGGCAISRSSGGSSSSRRSFSVGCDVEVLNGSGGYRVAGVEALEVGPRDQARRHALTTIRDAMAGTGIGLAAVGTVEVDVPAHRRTSRSGPTCHGASHTSQCAVALHVGLRVERVAATGHGDQRQRDYRCPDRLRAARRPNSAERLGSRVRSICSANHAA